MNHDTHIRPIHAVRWRNFRRLLGARKLTITAAALMLGKPQGQVSHFGGKRPTKVIGDQIAAEIEDAFTLPAGSMDVEQENPERFRSPASISHGEHEGQSPATRLDMCILSAAVRVITADEAHNGMYSFDRHAEVLMYLYDKLVSGEDAMALAIQITQQRSNGGANDNDPKGATA